MASDSIRIFEVGPRDGLQNEPRLLSLADKEWLVRSLFKTGIKDVEVGAFVRPDRVPQMANTDALLKRIPNLGTSWCLVPNRVGLERALKVGVTHFAVFTAATDSFARNNIGMTTQESLVEFREVIAQAKAELGTRLKVRGYVSTAFGCPFEGRVSAQKALRVIEKLANLGIHHISIGDTLGVANPRDVELLLKQSFKFLPVKNTAVHFHDTRGTALANTLRAIDMGVRIIDSSVGGLGGCPFAPGAAGNLATEDLVYMLDGMKMKTGVHLEELCKVSLKLSRKIKHPLTSRYLQAYVSKS